jgi:hypothetical protein
LKKPDIRQSHLPQYSIFSEWPRGIKILPLGHEVAKSDQDFISWISDLDFGSRFYISDFMLMVTHLTCNTYKHFLRDKPFAVQPG